MKAAIIEARMNSSRLPNKVLMDIFGKPMLHRIIERLRFSKNVENIIVATTEDSSDDVICHSCMELGVDYFRGSQDNVLNRVLEAANKFQVDIIIEICGDTPLIDFNILDKQMSIFENKELDYIGSNLKRTFPLGTDTKIFTKDALLKSTNYALTNADKENVSLFLYENPNIFKTFNYSEDFNNNYSEYRLVVDYEEDLMLVRKIYEELYPIKNNFNFYDVINLLNNNPELIMINKNVTNIEVAGRS